MDDNMNQAPEDLIDAFVKGFGPEQMDKLILVLLSKRFKNFIVVSEVKNDKDLACYWLNSSRMDRHEFLGLLHMAEHLYFFNNPLKAVVPEENKK